MTAMRGLLLAVFAVSVLGGCGTPALKKNGEACVASSECDKGLLCDTSSNTCQGMGQIGNVDAAIDGFVHPPTDGSGSSTPPDAPIDAAVDAAVDAAPDAM